MGKVETNITPRTTIPFGLEARKLWEKLIGTKPPEVTETVKQAQATIQFYCAECSLHKFLAANEEEAQGSPMWDPETRVTMKVGENLLGGKIEIVQY